MNKGFGGAQPKMRESKIENITYLGNFEHSQKLQIANTQSMVFTAIYQGPFYLSAEEKETRRFGVRHNETKSKKHTKAKLVALIFEKSNGTTKAQGTLKEIQAVARNMQILLEYDRIKTSEGWVGKPKGMLQILWERGHIDPTMTRQEILRKYSVHGKREKTEK